jgi:hypothetical protein
MKRLIIFCALNLLNCFIPESIFCQYSFSYQVKTQKDERILDAGEDENGNYYMVGRKMSSNPYMLSAYYLFLDNNGNLLSEKEFYNPDTQSYFSNIYLNHDSIFIFGAKSSTSSGDKDELWLLILDINYNLLLNKTFKIEGYNIVDLESIINSKGHFLICGTAYLAQGGSDIFFYEISCTGDSLHHSILSLDNSQFEFDLIEKKYGGYKVFAFGAFPGAPQTNSTIVEIDSAYNFVSADSVPYGLYNNLSAKWLSDSTYLLTGKKTIPNPTKADMGIIKLFENDQLIQGTYFGKTGDTNHHVGACSNLDYIDKDNIYYCGTSNIFENHLIYQPEDSWILINNIDSILNLNWQKFYGGDAFYYLWGIKATSDGGCLMLCTRYDDTVQDEELDIIILKVDSAGLLTSTGEGPQIPVQQLAIVPNPALDNVSIRYPDIFGYDDKEIEIYNSQGLPVISLSATQDLTETRVDVSALPAGLYFVVLKVEGKKVGTGKMVKM